MSFTGGRYLPPSGGFGGAPLVPQVNYNQRASLPAGAKFLNAMLSRFGANSQPAPLQEDSSIFNRGTNLGGYGSSPMMPITPNPSPGQNSYDVGGTQVSPQGSAGVPDIQHLQALLAHFLGQAPSGMPPSSSHPLITSLLSRLQLPHSGFRY